MKIIECPRDAMQGIEQFIPTELKVSYIDQLLKVGFDTIDFGSFVSPRAIPQMRDTAEVLGKIDWGQSASKLLAIVANKRGAEEGVKHEAITYLGFPLSISETFQQRNTNKSIGEALNELNEIQGICKKHQKELVAYISMGFGNPYGDIYDEEIVSKFTDILVTMDIKIISIADTVGAALPSQIQKLFTDLIQHFPKVEFGAHLHSSPETSIDKIESAYKGGCRRFDGAIKGWGGCPLAEDHLVGNLATETIISYLETEKEPMTLNHRELAKAISLSDQVFPK